MSIEEEKIRSALSALQAGRIDAQAALNRILSLVRADLGHSVVDHHRALRRGFPEVVFGQYKTPEQIAAIADSIRALDHPVLVTRVDADKARAVGDRAPYLTYRADARALVYPGRPPRRGGGTVAVVTAGTSDEPVAAEAAVTAEVAGCTVVRINDVGVAGIHRLFARIDDLRAADAIVVAAGMEGALPSVVAGLVSAPVIGLPTSVGYGVSQGGFAALVGMLSSCAAGVTVVNIDNGFGAGYAAAVMARKKAVQEEA